MKISVVGPGAIGILFAIRLTESAQTVTLVDHDTDRAERLAKSGLSLITENDITITTKPATATAIPAKQDLIIVCTKSYATQSLELPSNIPVLTIQNGLGNVETLCKIVGSSNVIAGSTSEAATLLEEGQIRHAASGITTLGAWAGCSTESAEHALKNVGFDIQATMFPGQMLWEKAVINAGINPLTALLNVPNGHLLHQKEIRQLMRDLVVEAARVASTEGYRFEYSLVEKAEEVCKKTASNISSMLQDVRDNRQTEIEAISGEILRRCDAASLTAPRTRVIYQLIKGMELSS
jgi:2-dehydropantoate 2-reductase